MNAPLLRSLLSSCAALVLWTCSQAPQPVAPTQGQSPAHAQAEGASTGGAPRFAAQEGWVEETPASPARQHQYRLPRVEGDGEDAELAVFHFQGGGGTAEMNISRWCSQFADVDGKSARELARVSEETVDGLKLTHVDLSGRYVAETTPGSGVRVDKPDTRMLAAVIEGQGGPWFVKLVGPAKTVARWEESYKGFLAGLR
jgi:hypothetical protein